MKRNRSLRLAVFSLICSLVVVLLGAVPLFDRHNDAHILMMLFGAFAAGISFRDILVRVRERKTGKEK